MDDRKTYAALLVIAALALAVAIYFAIRQMNEHKPSQSSGQTQSAS